MYITTVFNCSNVAKISRSFCHKGLHQIAPKCLRREATWPSSNLHCASLNGLHGRFWLSDGSALRYAKNTTPRGLENFFNSSWRANWTASSTINTSFQCGSRRAQECNATISQTTFHNTSPCWSLKSDLVTGRHMKIIDKYAGCPNRTFQDLTKSNDDTDPVT